MGFTSFAGRAFFAAIFIFAAWQKINSFGSDGGPTAKAMEPKVALFKAHVSSNLGFSLPDVEIKYLLMAAIGLEGLGGILFTFGSTLGAYFLLIFLASSTPIMHDFYNHEIFSSDYTHEFIQFLKNLSLFGALLFFLGMRNYAVKSSKKKLVKAKTN